MKLSRFSAIAAVGALFSGCMVGPDYNRPSTPVAREFKERAPEGWAEATPSDGAPKGNWWTDFHDPLLDDLEPQVAVSNQSVRQSYANYLQAVAEVKVARAQLFPVIGVTGSTTRTGGPASSGSAGAKSQSAATSTTFASSGGTSLGAGRTVTSGSLDGTASWTLDIWGQVRRLIEENTAIAQSDEATLANATLSEQTLLATTIIELRLTDANIDLEEKTVQAYEEALRIAKAQGDAGIAATPPSAVITAQVALESAEASLIGLGVARAQYAHAIAVLVGKTPEELDIVRSNVMPTLPEIPVGVPSTLLQRRPDIAAAERTMRAQNAAVGVAVAAYYPTISLSGSAGFAQSPLNGLLHAANYSWSIGANGTETLFDFGERQAEVAAARAAYDASVASYRNTVLTAFEDVENDLSGLRILASQAKALDRAVHDAIHGTEIALAEFEAGTVDYTTVALAEETQLADQQSALNVQQSRLLAAISLIGDLGGGWSESDLHDPSQPKSLPSEESESPNR
jgi:NodT family efflux transporter outer membrane factor (OMF) lipoprotein